MKRRRRGERKEDGDLAVDDFVHSHEFQGTVVLRALGIRVQVGTEPEAFVQDGITVVRLVHVVVDLGEGDVEVQIVLEDDAVEKNEKDSKRSILELGQLDIHRPELHAPADVGVGRGRLEPHCLPVGRLNVLHCCHHQKVPR